MPSPEVPSFEIALLVGIVLSVLFGLILRSNERVRAKFWKPTLPIIRGAAHFLIVGFVVSYLYDLFVKEIYFGQAPLHGWFLALLLCFLWGRAIFVLMNKPPVDSASENHR